VIEPTFGLDRTILAVLCEGFTEETLEDGSTRTVLKLVPSLAPVKVAVFPLMKKDGLPEKSREILEKLRVFGNVEYDQSGAIGKRYRRNNGNEIWGNFPGLVVDQGLDLTEPTALDGKKFPGGILGNLGSPISGGTGKTNWPTRKRRLKLWAGILRLEWFLAVERNYSRGLKKFFPAGNFSNLREHGGRDFYEEFGQGNDF